MVQQHMLLTYGAHLKNVFISTYMYTLYGVSRNSCDAIFQKYVQDINLSKIIVPVKGMS